MLLRVSVGLFARPLLSSHLTFVASIVKGLPAALLVAFERLSLVRGGFDGFPATGFAVSDGPLWAEGEGSNSSDNALGHDEGKDDPTTQRLDTTEKRKKETGKRKPRQERSLTDSHSLHNHILISEEEGKGNQDKNDLSSTLIHSTIIILISEEEGKNDLPISHQSHSDLRRRGGRKEGLFFVSQR